VDLVDARELRGQTRKDQRARNVADERGRRENGVPERIERVMTAQARGRYGSQSRRVNDQRIVYLRGTGGQAGNGTDWRRQLAVPGVAWIGGDDRDGVTVGGKHPRRNRVNHYRLRRGRYIVARHHDV